MKPFFVINPHVTVVDHLPQFNGEFLKLISTELSIFVLVHGVKDQPKLLTVILVNAVQQTPKILYMHSEQKRSLVKPITDLLIIGHPGKSSICYIAN